MDPARAYDWKALINVHLTWHKKGLVLILCDGGEGSEAALSHCDHGRLICGIPCTTPAVCKHVQDCMAHRCRRTATYLRACARSQPTTCGQTAAPSASASRPLPSTTCCSASLAWSAPSKRLCDPGGLPHLVSLACMKLSAVKPQGAGSRTLLSTYAPCKGYGRASPFAEPVVLKLIRSLASRRWVWDSSLSLRTMHGLHMVSHNVGVAVRVQEFDVQLLVVTEADTWSCLAEG